MLILNNFSALYIMSNTRSRRLKQKAGGKGTQHLKHKRRKSLKKRSKRHSRGGRRRNKRSRRSGGLRRKKRSRRRQRGGDFNFGIPKETYIPLSKNGAANPGGVDPYFGNQSGGSGRDTIIPQDIVNFGRDIISGPTKLLMDWQGQKMSPSHQPTPTNQPIDNDVKYLYSDPPDVMAIHTAAGKAVANI